MKRRCEVRRYARLSMTFVLLLASMLPAQVVFPPGFPRPMGPPNPPPPTQTAPAGQPPAGQAPATPAPAQQAAPAPPQIAPPSGGLNLQNASLTQVIDVLARQLKINYIIDPGVRGSVTINTYGETKMNNRELLDTILRINGFAMIQLGEIYRIVPLANAQRLPIPPEIDGRPSSEDDRTMLNLIFLKYANVDDLSKLLNEFIGEHAKTWVYPAANLFVIQDSRRNMRRTMEMISLFDNDAFAGQRVRLFEVKNSRPSDIAKELEGVFKSISLNEKAAPVRFSPIDRINIVIAVAPNPAVFAEVEKWLAKLDIEVQAAAGAVDNYVYRVRYGQAYTLAYALMSLYTGAPMSGFGMGGMMGGGGMYGQPGMMGGGGMPGGGMYGGGGGMYGGGGGMYGGGGGYAGGGFQQQYMQQPGTPIPGVTGGVATGTPGQTRPNDLTGAFLGGGGGQTVPQGRFPRIIPNPLDNTLLIQATPEEYRGITKLLRDLDVPPRQVLIQARIYEVNLAGELTSGVSAYLNRIEERREGLGNGSRQFAGSLAEGQLALSVGKLVGESRELLALFSTSELKTQARMIAAPDLIATDSIPASINVGIEVPTLTAQALTGVQSEGTSLFANSIQNRNSGLTLTVQSRINPTGVVTLLINQEISAPQAPAPTAAIQSPSFSKRTLQTQITVQDGDTIAIAGVIQEENSNSNNGVPGLSRIPVLGRAFSGQRSRKNRTELVVFLTPRVIYDTNDLIDASDEIRSRLRKLQKSIRDE